MTNCTFNNNDFIGLESRDSCIIARQLTLKERGLVRMYLLFWFAGVSKLYRSRRSKTIRCASIRKTTKTYVTTFYVEKNASLKIIIKF